MQGFAADGDLPLLHRLQQRRLHLRRRAVDLVGQQDVGEDRTPLHRELAGALVVDHRADEVGRQQVGSELHPAAIGLDGGGDGLYREGLGEARQPLEQDMTIGEQSKQQPLEQDVLPHDHPLCLGQHTAHAFALRGDLVAARGGGARGE